MASVLPVQATKSTRPSAKQITFDLCFAVWHVEFGYRFGVDARRFVLRMQGVPHLRKEGIDFRAVLIIPALPLTNGHQCPPSSTRRGLASNSCPNAQRNLSLPDQSPFCILSERHAPRETPPPFGRPPASVRSPAWTRHSHGRSAQPYPSP